MNHEQVISPGVAPEITGSASPVIEYHPKVLDETVPYSVYVDPEKCARFFRDFGMSSEHIQSTRIRVRRKALINPFKFFGLEVAGSYNPLNDNITIYCDWAWKGYQRRLAIAEKMSTGKERKWPFRKRDEKCLNAVLYTRKLPNYLRNVDPERSLPFAQRLLIKANNRRHSGILIHETRHKLDWSTRSKTPIVLSSMGLKIVSLYGTAYLFNYIVGEYITPTNIDVLNSLIQQVSVLGVFPPTLLAEYKVDPLEIRARRFDHENSNNPNYRSIVTITPKI